MQKRFELFYNSIYTLIQVYLFQLVLFTAFRITFIVRLSDASEFLKLPADTAKAFIKGFQFDTLIISYGLIIPLLIYFSETVFSIRKI